jgi:hypothetical protein
MLDDMQTVASKTKELLAPKQFAAEYGLHVQTVWRRIREGDLEAVRLGPNGPLRISRAAIAAFLQPVTTDGSD